MAPGFSQGLPSTPDEWLAEKEIHNVTSIHELEAAKSGSKITIPQFLALKTIWRRHNVNTFNKDEWPLRFGSTAKALQEMSTKIKKDDPAWYAYLNALLPASGQLPNSQFPGDLGRFALVLQNQLEVRNLKSAELEVQKVSVTTPSVAGRLRSSKGPSVEAVPFALQERDSGSPESESLHDGGKIPEIRGSSDVSEARSQASVFSAIDFDMPIDQRNAMTDEQVVNTAAITLLQSLFIHDEGRNAYWSAQRKGFCLRNGTRNPAAFKAFTDGHLKVDGISPRSAALLEVKARMRPRVDDFRIEMQESAQMALWIYEETSSYWTSKDHDSQCQ